MPKYLWAVTGFCAAAVGFILFAPKREQPVAELAHKLEEAWSDHHSVD